MNNHTDQGSNAGRGFRYQDAVIAMLTLECWKASNGKIVPEGRDDAEIQNEDGDIYVQVKSRRQRRGKYKVSEIRSHIREMWKRARASNVKPKALILIIETSIQGDMERETSLPFDLNDCSVVSDKLKNDEDAPQWLPNTSIRIVSNPAKDAKAIFYEQLNWEALYCGILFASILHRVGYASDQNGELKNETRISVSSNEVQVEIERLIGVLNPKKLPEAIAAGYCSAVDFDTPLEEPEFYTGVTVRPGHFSAGLVVLRPEECIRIIEMLEQTRRSIIADPSGSGKSALMWNAARDCKHTIRWFEIHATANPDVASLFRFLDLLEPSLAAPVGFVFDDVGRNGMHLWKQLSARLQSYSGVLLLSSIREEDQALLDAASRSSIQRFPIENELPKRIWSELLEDKKTTIKGWREAWDISNGLLLEYVHILTQGRKLKDTIQEQVERRLNEHRDDELALVRVLSVATQTGATVEVALLKKFINIKDENILRALKRLENEHVVRPINNGRSLIALHQLRSQCLATCSHDGLVYDYKETLSIVTKIVSPEGLEALLSFHASNQTYIDCISQTFLKRFNATKSLHELSSFLDGIDLGNITHNAIEWVDLLINEGLPKTQAGTIALFALSDLELPKPILQEHSLLHKDLQRRTKLDQRSVHILEIEEGICEAIKSNSNLNELTQILTSFYGCKIPKSIKNAFTNNDIDLLTEPLNDVTNFMSACIDTDRELAISLVKRVGRQSLANRLLEIMPNTTEPKFYQADDLRVIESNYVISSVNSEIDFDEVNKMILDTLQALAPTADRIDTDILRGDGITFQIGEWGIYKKSVRRDVLVGAPKPRRFRRWNTAIGYALAPKDMTNYLSEGADIFDDALRRTSLAIEAILKGKNIKPHLNKLETLGNRASQLVKPPINDIGAIGVSLLQSVSYFLTVDLLPRLAELPKGALALHACLYDQIDHIEKFMTEESWHLLSNGSPKRSNEAIKFILSLMRIVEYCDLKKISFASAIEQLNPLRKKQSLEKLSFLAEKKLDIRCDEILNETRETLYKSGISTHVISDSHDDKLGKRNFSILILIEIDPDIGVSNSMEIISDAVRIESNQFRSVTLAPTINGKIIGQLVFTGVDTWFPIGDNLEKWSTYTEIEYFRSPLLDAFEELHKMTLVSSAQKLSNISEDNPEAFSKHWATFLKYVPDTGINNLSLEDIRDFFEGLFSTPDFARDQYDALHEKEVSELISLVQTIREQVISTAIEKSLF